MTNGSKKKSQDKLENTLREIKKNQNTKKLIQREKSLEESYNYKFPC